MNKMVEIDGHVGEQPKQTYNIGRLNAFQQLHVARRLAPLFADMTKFANSEQDPFSAIASTLSKMSDQDVEYVLNKCLSVCSRRQEIAGTMTWAPVQASGTSTLMFQDIGLRAMIDLAVNVIQENLGSFFNIAPPS